MAKTHWAKTKNSDYMGSWDLMNDDGSYGTATLTIAGIVQTKYPDPKTGRKEDVIVCDWVEHVKPMILNTTNKRAISTSTGSPFLEDWAGHKVIVGVEEGIKAFGEIVDALRIKPIPVPSHECEVCGKPIADRIYEGSMKKYGHAFCSKSCKLEMLPEEQKEDDAV